jgi:hypothetical protein
VYANATEISSLVQGSGMDGRQIVAHLVGDYLLQTDHQAVKKTSQSLPALAHALCYSLPFLSCTRDPRRLALVAGTHFVIDRWRLASYVVWAKNQLAPKEYRYSWSEAHPTGYPKGHPEWLVFSLLVAADNTLHIVINAAILEGVDKCRRVSMTASPA